jgi:hypothetical protein
LKIFGAIYIHSELGGWKQQQRSLGCHPSVVIDRLLNLPIRPLANSILIWPLHNIQHGLMQSAGNIKPWPVQQIRFKILRINNAVFYETASKLMAFVFFVKACFCCFCFTSCRNHCIIEDPRAFGEKETIALEPIKIVQPLLTE